MGVKKRVIFSIMALFAVVVLVSAGILFYYRNSIEINNGSIEYCMKGDKLQISWRSGADGGIYRLSRYDEDAEDYVFCGDYAGGGAELAGIEAGRRLTLKMQGVRGVSIFGHTMEIPGKALILTVVPEELDCPVLLKNADTEKRSMTLTWAAEPDSRYQIYLRNEEGVLELYSETEKGEITLSADDVAALSGREQVVGVSVRAVHRKEDYTLCSALSDPVVFGRGDLMDDAVHLVCQDNGENRYTLSWQESRGDWYELQEWSPAEGEWVSRQVYEWSEPLSYETGRLPSCTKVRFRVITYDSGELRDRGVFAAEPSEVDFRTERSPVYCTVWPLTALNILEDPSGKSVTGQAPAGKALCVLEEKEGYFLVRHEGGYGYIDSRYCLIDLAEYLGNLCKYNITNSYSSIFQAHGYEIPEITGTVIKGYENIHTENGDTLVPYLYPCAEKLYQAALLAEADGYFLCIYDAFRPNEATRYLYDTFEALLDKPVPEEESEEGAEQKAEEPVDERTEKIRQLSGELSPGTAETLKRLSEEALTALYVLSEEELKNPGPITPEEAEAPETETEQEPAPAGLSPEDTAMLQGLPAEDISLLKTLTREELTELQTYLINVLTYRKVVTDYRFAPNYFLSRTISTHNRGIALDLTLGSAATGEDLAMQTDIHDLSWHSMLEKNNENADRLASYMKGVGYKGLISEWWHFQDDETRYALNLGYLEKGVSPEGWKKDDLGWKYRLADGTYCHARTVVIEEQECTFNEEGYLTES